MNIPQLDNTYIANTYARFPVTIARGKGSLVWDANDKVYIDMATGIAVNSFGIADPAWIRAVTEQLCTVQHTSNLYYTAPDAQLAQLLCEKTGMKKVFFSNSGAEANECAIKAARKYAADHKGPEYHTIITLKNSFHGRTITTLAATGQDVFHHDFLPLTDTPLVAVVPPDFPWESDTIPLERLLREPFLSNPDQYIEPFLPPDTPRLEVTASDDGSILSMVAGGLGVSVLSAFSLVGYEGQVRVLQLEEPIALRLGAAVKSMNTAGTSARTFLSFLREYYGKNDTP